MKCETKEARSLSLQLDFYTYIKVKEGKKKMIFNVKVTEVVTS